MTYKKPADVTFTDMAIWIDEHAYEENCDDEKLFKYLYFLIYMLAKQASYFKGAQYYDDFAMTSASRVFMRLKNPKQFDGIDEDARLKKIKSILNYLKSIMYPMKVDFEQENYVQTGFKENDSSLLYDSEVNFRDQLVEAIDQLNLVDFELYLGDVVRTMRAFLRQIPIKRKSPEWMNIYTSCLLTFLNSITLSNENKRKLQELDKIPYSKHYLIDKMYKEERENCVILYHLDENMRDYIYVLTNRLRRIIARDLSTTLRSYVPGDAMARGMLAESMDQNEEDYTDNGN